MEILLEMKTQKFCKIISSYKREKIENSQQSKLERLFLSAKSTALQKLYAKRGISKAL